VEVEEVRRAREAEALYVAAQVELREARERYESAPWYKKRSAARAVKNAEARVQAYAPDQSGDVRGPK
jgi:membrane protein